MYLDLQGAGCDGRLLEDGAKNFPSSHSIVQHLVVCVISRFARQIVELPFLYIDVRSDPRIQNQIHRVVCHLLTFER